MSIRVVEIKDLFWTDKLDNLRVAAIGEGAFFIVGRDQFRIGDLAFYFEPGTEVSRHLVNELGIGRYTWRKENRLHMICPAKIGEFKSWGLLHPVPKDMVGGWLDKLFRWLRSAPRKFLAGDENITEDRVI